MLERNVKLENINILFQTFEVWAGQLGSAQNTGKTAWDL